MQPHLRQPMPTSAPPQIAVGDSRNGAVHVAPKGDPSAFEPRHNREPASPCGNLTHPANPLAGLNPPMRNCN